MTFLDIFPKMAILSGTKMAKNTFYRHDRFKPNRNKTTKLKTLIGAQVHNQHNRLITLEETSERAKKNLQEKSTFPVGRQLEECLNI